MKFGGNNMVKYSKTYNKERKIINGYMKSYHNHWEIKEEISEMLVYGQYQTAQETIQNGLKSLIPILRSFFALLIQANSFRSTFLLSFFQTSSA